MNSFKFFNKITYNSNNLFNAQRKFFSVLPKCPKMELTMRTPYFTFFESFTGFNRLYVGTMKGQKCISNRTPPVIYILPAGEIKVMNLQKSNNIY